MEEKQFNLLHEPWILVLTKEGNKDTLSLLDLFRKAHELIALSGETEAQNIAVLRFLLAILYAIFVRQALNGQWKPIQSDQDAVTRWSSIWEKGSFPAEVIETYLLSHEERFWLFHPSHPFYQVPVSGQTIQLSPELIIKPTIKPLGSLIGDILESENKNRHFKSRILESGISFNEAARWLLYLNSFDSAPAGSPGNKAVGLSIKGYGVGWLGRIGTVWASGADLFETLMLNFVLFSAHVHWESCSPDWEKKDVFDPSILLDTEPGFPNDLCGLYTMKFRLIKLLKDDVSGKVNAYELWSGKVLDTKNAFLEPMTIWQKINNDYIPKLNDPARQLWRDFSAMIPVGMNKDLVPGVIKWLADLVEYGLLSLPMFKMNIVGITYTNNTAVEHIFYDSLNINKDLLSNLGVDWYNRITAILHETDQLAYQIVHLERNLRKSAGDSESINKINKAIEQVFFELDEPFRIWLESVHSENDMDEKCRQWQNQAKNIVRSIGQKMTLSAGIPALTGRTIYEDTAAEKSLQNRIMTNIELGNEIKKPKENQRKRVSKRYTAAEAFNQFLKRTG